MGLVRILIGIQDVDLCPERRFLVKFLPCYVHSALVHDVCKLFRAIVWLVGARFNLG